MTIHFLYPKPQEDLQKNVIWNVRAALHSDTIQLKIICYVIEPKLRAGQEIAFNSFWAFFYTGAYFQKCTLKSLTDARPLSQSVMTSNKNPSILASKDSDYSTGFLLNKKKYTLRKIFEWNGIFECGKTLLNSMPWKIQIE